MDLLQLRAFVAVAENLHFGRAAEQLHLAQPYLTRKIQSLEDDLGAALFIRTTRRVELSAAGTALLDHARTMLATEAEARASVTAAREGRSGRVRISFAGPSAHIVVGQLARAVRERHPRIDLELRPGRYGTSAVVELLRKESDIALARFLEPPAGVSSRSVDRERFVMAIPTGHRLADQEELRFADFRDEPFVAFPETVGSAVRAVLVARCQVAGFVPRFVQSAPDSWTCVALVAAGVGLHFITDRAVEHLPLDGVRVRELAEPLPPIDVYLMWRHDDDSPALDRVLRTSEQVLPDTGDRSTSDEAVTGAQKEWRRVIRSI